MPLHILIADDSSTNRLLFTTAVTRLGHTADAAANGDEALEMFASTAYDLIFLDLNMPIMDGIRTALALQQKNPRRIPVYAISGYCSAADEKKFASAGIRRCIIKPLDRQRINDVIAECGLTVTTQPATGDGVPKKLMDVYARELRSRADAALRMFRQEDARAVLREAHTLRALAQMLKSHHVENAAAAVENAINHASITALHDACIMTAAELEKKL
jgi:CheY-like chemotaxis protein